MKDIQKEIIAYIKRNRVSTTEVADCLGKPERLRMFMRSTEDTSV